MKRALALLSLCAFFAVFALSAPAVMAGNLNGAVWAMNSSGLEDDSFWDNETIYIGARNITLVSQYVRVYIVNNTGSLSNGTVLTDDSTGFKEFVTNSTGDLPMVALWDVPRVGNFDIVVDIGRDGNFTSEADYMDSASATGFSVSLAPRPVLYVSKGENDTDGHNVDISADKTLIMMQLKLEPAAGSIRIDSLSLTAMGSGDEVGDIAYVTLVDDRDTDGAYTTEDRLLAYSNYFIDNGIVMLEIQDGKTINNVSYMLIVYELKDPANEDTFSFDIVNIHAEAAATGESTDVYTLPIKSGLFTITGSSVTTTTVANDTNTTTTTVASNETTTTTSPNATTTTAPGSASTTLAPTNTTGGPLAGGLPVEIIMIIIGVIAVGAVLVYLFWGGKKKEGYDFAKGGWNE